jgi:DsbC/DsbD-like thiol-disulfide interchange protein
MRTLPTMMTRVLVAALFGYAQIPMTQAAPKTKVRLILAAESARPGETVLAGIEMRMPAHWHTYWRNPGDSGQATEIRWTLPAAIAAGPVQWPVPEKLVAPPLVTYVYSSNVVLLIPLQIGNEASLGMTEIKATVSWLECGQLCLPGKSTVQASLRIGPDSKASPDLALIEAWKKSLPASAAASFARAQFEKAAQDDVRPLRIEVDLPTAAASVDFFPYGGPAYEVNGETELLLPGPNKFTLRKTVKRQSGDWPRQIEGLVIVPQGAAGRPRAFEVRLLLSL